MDYRAAIEESRRVGMSHAKGKAHLAIACEVVAMIHPGVNPALLYAGAVKQGVRPSALLKMSAGELSDLMFA